MVRILLFFSGFGRRNVFLGLILGVTCVAYGQTQDCDTSGKKVTCAIRDSTGYVVEVHRYKDGLKSGNWEKFNYNGQLIEKNFYKKGVRTWTFFYRDDEVIKSINKKGKVRKFKGCGCT
jgi:hypothetical protein